jgi:predicted dehydrogenase
VASGAHREIRALKAHHKQPISSDPSQRHNALELGGGALLDLGVYPISFAWDILGEPLAITASARLGDTGADTEVATVMSHVSGALSTSLSTSRAAGPNTAHIVGTDARIDIDRVWYSPTSFRVVAADGTVLEEYVTEVEGRGMQYQALAAEQYLAEGRTDSVLLPIEETVAIMSTLDEIRRLVGVSYPGEE